MGLISGSTRVPFPKPQTVSRSAGLEIPDLLQILNNDIHRLNDLVCLASVAVVAVVAVASIPPGLPKDISSRMADLPRLVFTSEEYVVIVQKAKALRSTIKILGIMRAIQQLLQLLPDHPDRMSPLIPSIFARLSDVERRLPKVYSSVTNQSDMDIWAGINNKMSKEHKFTASAVVQSMLDRIMRQTIEDMC